MAKNKLSDLNDHLFAQLERLSDEHLKPEQIQSEIERSKAVAAIAKPIIENAKLTLDAAKFVSETGLKISDSFGIDTKTLKDRNTES